MQRQLLAVALLAIALQCSAADSVRLTYNPGYPLPGLSTERTEVVVTRTFTWPGSSAEIDKYFNAVSEIVTVLEQSNCGVLAIHAPTVTVRIDLGDRSLSLECALSASGVPTDIDAPPGQLVQKQAFDRLLKLTIERSNAMLRQ